MGNWFLKDKFSPPTNVLVSGLDASGKTTFLYQLHKVYRSNEEITTKVVNFITIENSSVKKLNMNIHSADAGGRDRSRYVLVAHVLPVLDGIIWMIDSNDRERLNEMYEEIERFLFKKLLCKEEYSKKTCIPILFLANKQDLPCAMSVAELNERLADFFAKIKDPQNRRVVWTLVPCCATTAEGLLEGIQHLQHLMQKTHSANLGTNSQ